MLKYMNYQSYAPPPITGKDSLLAFLSKQKASVALVAVRTVEVVPWGGFEVIVTVPERETHATFSFTNSDGWTDVDSMRMLFS